MGNVLDTLRQQQVVALGRLGWSLRRIERETGVRRETVSDYLKAAGIAVRRRGRPGEGKGKPAISAEVSTDSPPTAWPPLPTRAPQASACEPYRDRIEAALQRGRDAMAIWQDLVDDGFPARYASVRRFVRQLRGSTPPEARVVITTSVGEETRKVDAAAHLVILRKVLGQGHRFARLVLSLAPSSRQGRFAARNEDQIGIDFRDMRTLPKTRRANDLPFRSARSPFAGIVVLDDPSDNLRGRTLSRFVDEKDFQSVRTPL